MIITLDTNYLLTSKLTAEEFMICHLLSHKEYVVLEEYSKLFSAKDFIILLKNLELKRLIKLQCDVEKQINFTEISVRATFSDVTKPENLVLAFEELRELYPKKTPDGRRLHIKIADAKKKYLAAIKGRDNLHKLILQALKVEISERSITNKLMYMNNLFTYIHQEGWNAYMEDVLRSDSTEAETNVKGQDRFTPRAL